MESVNVIMRFRGGERGPEEDFAPYHMTENTVRVEGRDHTFTYDAVVGSEKTQEDTFNVGGKPTVASFMDGFNATIFAYGQSGSGKTFTMLGPEDVTEALVNPTEAVPEDVQAMYGIIPRATFQLFDIINQGVGEGTSYNLKVSYIEIYNEGINDILCNPPNQGLPIREFPNLGMCVVGMVERVITTPEDIFECLALGTANRVVCATGQNARSSRSHTVFVLVCEQKLNDGSTKVSKLNLVDLAGSEKIAKTHATGQALKEAQKINLSLTTLGRCIKALTDAGDNFVPFRESKLTLILKESLGGNSKTSLLCTASRKKVHQEETVGTMKFAERAKQIKVKAKANVKKSPEELERMINALRNEVTTLRKQLREGSGGGDAPTESAVASPEDEEARAQYYAMQEEFKALRESTEAQMKGLQAELDVAREQEPVVDHIAQREEIDELLDKVSELKSTLSNSETATEELRLSLNHDITAAKESVGSLERTAEQLRALTKAAEEKRVDAASRLQDHTEQIDDLATQTEGNETTKADLSAQITLLRQQIEDESARVTQLRASLDSKTHELHDLRESATKSAEALQERASDLKNIKAKITEAESRLKHLTDDHEKADSVLSDILDKVEDRKGAVEEVEKDRAELAETVKAEAAEAAQEQSVLQQRLDTANASIAELKARLEENAAVKTMLAEQDAVIASLKADQADELTKERAINQDQIAKLKDELNTSKQARKAKVTATREQIQAQNSALATVQQQLEGVTKSLTETQNKSWDLATANEKLRYRVETVRTGVEKQRATNERRAGEMEKMRQEIELLRASKAASKAEQEAYRTEIEAAFADSDAKILDLKKSVNALDAQAKTSANTLDAAKSDTKLALDTLRDKLATKEETLRSYRNKIAQCNEDIDKARREITTKKEELTKEKKNTDTARKQSVAMLNSQAFGGRKKTVVKGPIDAPTIQTVVETTNRFMLMAGLKRTNNKFMREAIEEARRASEQISSEDFKVDVSSLYTGDGTGSQQPTPAEDAKPDDHAVQEEDSDSSDSDSSSEHSSDTDSDDDLEEEN